MLPLRIALSSTCAAITCCISTVVPSCSFIAACVSCAYSFGAIARMHAADASGIAQVNCRPGTLACQMQDEFAGLECTHMVECLVRTKPAYFSHSVRQNASLQHLVLIGGILVREFTCRACVEWSLMESRVRMLDGDYFSLSIQPRPVKTSARELQANSACACACECVGCMRRACAVLGVCVNAAGSVLVRANLRGTSMSLNLHQQLGVCNKKLRARTLHTPQPHAARRPARSYTSANRAQNVQYASAALQLAPSSMLSHLILL